MMPEMRFTDLPALSGDPRVGISWSAAETEDRLFFLPIIGKIEVLKFYNKRGMMANSERHSEFSVTARNICK